MNFSKVSPGWCGSEDWVPACEPRGRWFDSQSAHMSGLQARSPVEGAWEATTHWWFSPYLSPFLPLSLKINKYILKISQSEYICVASFQSYRGLIPLPNFIIFTPLINISKNFKYFYCWHYYRYPPFSPCLKHSTQPLPPPTFMTLLSVSMGHAHMFFG